MTDRPVARAASASDFALSPAPPRELRPRHTLLRSDTMNLPMSSRPRLPTGRAAAAGRSIAVALLAALTVALTPQASAKPLLTPAELAQQLADPASGPTLRLLDIRAGREANGRSPFDNGHIKGAQSAPYSQWRGPKDNPGKLLPTAQLIQLAQQAGIERDTPVVVIFAGADATDFGAAARVAWTLRAGGVQKVSILNGGMAAWTAARLPVTTDVDDALPTPFELVFDPKLLATRAEVEAVLARRAASGVAGSSGTRLLDARPPTFFLGDEKHAAARTPGTIAGSRNLDNNVWFKPDSAEMVSVDEARAIARAQGIDTAAPTISFCNTGHWAATNWFVLHEVLGQTDVKLYPDSMVEWSNAGLAMDHVPGRLKQFWQQIRQALAN